MQRELSVSFVQFSCASAIADHFRYFASVIRAEESSITELDASTVSIALGEPLGVIAQYTMEFPYFNGCMETSSSACRRKYSGAKTSRKYSISILVLMELMEIFYLLE
jgi:aldehyde dehydrogenase